MSAARPLLTIAIPTYNRANFLSGLLTSLLELSKLNPSNVEFIVSDNASSDATAAVVNEFQARGLPLRYIRNETNIGADANFLQCFMQARGQYAWIFGDDDSIDPLGVKKLLTVLGSGEEFDLIFMAPQDVSSRGPSERKDEFQYRVVTDPVAFSRLVTAVGDFLFISSMIINKDRVGTDILDRCGEMIGSQVVQLTWVFAALRQMTKSLFVTGRVVFGGRDLHRGNFDAGRVFVVNYTKAIDVWLAQDPKLKESLVNDLMVFWFSNWISLRRQSCRVSTANTRVIVERLAERKLKYFVFVFPLIKFPLNIASMWCRGLGVIRRIIRRNRMAVPADSWSKRATPDLRSGVA